MPIIHEKSDNGRYKGVEFDLQKNAKTKEQKTALKKVVGAVAKQQNGNYKLSTTSTGADYMDSKLKSRVETFDKEKAKAILESDDIIKEYNLWIDADIDHIINNDGLAYRTGEAEQFAINISNIMKETGIPEQDIRNYLKGTFYYTSDDPEKIKKLLTLRIKYCQKITSLLSEMIKNNYKILGYTEQEAEIILQMLNDDNNSGTIASIKSKIIENKNNFITNNGECIDLSSLGFGKIFITKGIDMLNSYLKAVDTAANGFNIYRYKNQDNSDQALDSFLQKAMTYDAIVVCHGTSANDKKYNNQAKSLQIKKELLNKMGADTRYAPDMRLNNKQLDPNNKSDKDYGKGQRWMMQPIRSDKSQYFTDMNSFIEELLKEGYYKILIASCNPGSHKIDERLLAQARSKGGFITYSDYSNLIESSGYEYDLSNSLDMQILEGEQQLIQLAESFGVDYYGDFTNVLNEGLIGNLREYGKKVVEFVIGLFQKLWGYIKKAARFIKEKIFKNGASNDKIPQKLKLKLIFSESAQNKEFEITNQSQLEELAQKSIDSIQKELTRVQQIQVKATKQLNDLAQKLQEKPVKEDYVYEDDLLDFLGYSTVSEALVLNEAVLSSKERKDLPSTAFGLPDKRKFPLNDYDHVIMAIKFFNRCDKKDQEELAKNIIKAMKKYKVPYDKIGKNNKLRNYIPSLNESVVNEGLFKKDPYKDMIKKYKKYNPPRPDCNKTLKDIENNLVPDIAKNIGIRPIKINNNSDDEIRVTFKSDNVSKIRKCYDAVVRSKGVKDLNNKSTIVKYKDCILFVSTSDEDDEIDTYGFDLTLSILYCKEYANICKIPTSAIETLCKNVSIFYTFLITPAFASFSVHGSGVAYQDKYPEIEKSTGCKIVPKGFVIYMFSSNTVNESYPGNPVVGLNTEQPMVVDNMMNNAFTSLSVDQKIIDDCLNATAKALINKEDKFYVPYIPYISESLNIDPNIGFYKDTNGIFVMNENTGLRSPSYKDVDDIDDRTILYIAYGELNDAKMNDL